VLRQLPNALSGARVLAAPALVGFALGGYERVFAVVLIAALATDILDGWIARRYQLQSAFGAMLDSIGDVTTLIAAAIGIAVFRPDVWQQHFVAICLVLGAWAVESALALVRYGRMSSFHTYAAKAAGYALGIFIATLFTIGYVAWLFYIAVAVSLLSTAEELLLLWRLPQWRADVRGLWWVMTEHRSTRVS
jgi:CDP-diacylglycerol--glycerol-3-phosphate 3-phosphatidyltransferase